MSYVVYSGDTRRRERNWILDELYSQEKIKNMDKNGNQKPLRSYSKAESERASHGEQNCSWFFRKSITNINNWFQSQNWAGILDCLNMARPTSTIFWCCVQQHHFVDGHGNIRVYDQFHLILILQGKLLR